jgi:hypothetical protein
MNRVWRTRSIMLSGSPAGVAGSSSD